MDTYLEEEIMKDKKDKLKRLLKKCDFYIEDETVYFWIDILEHKEDLSSLMIIPFTDRFINNIQYLEKDVLKQMSIRSFRKVSIKLSNIVSIFINETFEDLIDYIEIDSPKSLVIEENEGYIFRRKSINSKNPYISGSL